MYKRQAKGHGIGKSLCEEDKIEYANKLISLSQVKGVKIHLPLDCVATLEAKADVPTIVIDTETSIPDDMMGLDIGPKTIKAFCEVIKEAKTIFWNGPMGVFELEPFRSGTEKVAIAVADVATVSYTHLDVYKRQILAYLFKYDSVHRRDVYKRQGECFPQGTLEIAF